MEKMMMMRTNRTTIALLALVVATLVTVLAIPASTIASGHLKDYDVDSDGNAGNGLECTIHITGVDTAGGHSDVTTMGDTLVNAMTNSEDMRTKVADACRKNGNSLTIEMVRNSPSVYAGEAQMKWKDGDNDGTPDDENGDGKPDAMVPAGVIRIDPVDFSDLVNLGTVDGKPEDKTALGLALWVDILAHEIDHERHDPGVEEHLDPPANGDSDGDGESDRHDGTGAAVDDANKVHKQLGDGVHRNNYGDDVGDVTWTVDTQSLLWNIYDWFAGARTQTQVDVAALETVAPGTTQQIPDTKSLPAGQPDHDFDGIIDSWDNAQFWANPGQGDPDNDGTALPLDTDRDNDGDNIPDIFEAAGGSRPFDIASMKEHWAAGTTCSDGVDNDGDLYTDSLDHSCLANMFSFPAATGLPEKTPPREVFPLGYRADLGGLSVEDLDLVPFFLRLAYDTDSNGTADKTLEFNGHAVIEHGAVGDNEPDGMSDMPVEVVAFKGEGKSLDGDPDFDLLRITGGRDLGLPNAPDTPTYAERTTSLTLPGGLAVDSFFDITYRIDFTNGPTTAVQTTDPSIFGHGDSAQWPPVNTGFPQSGPTPLESTLAEPMGQMLQNGSSLMFDFEGPATTLTKPSASFDTDRVVPVAGTATDALSGVESYDIRHRTAAWNGAFGAGYTYDALDRLTSTMNVTVPQGKTVCFDERATDRAGNDGAWSSEKCTATPLDSNQMSAVGAPWSRTSCAGCYLRTLRSSSSQGATLRLNNVQAGLITVYADTCATCGTLVMKWKGTTVKRVSLHSARTRHMVPFLMKNFTGVQTGRLDLVVGSVGKPVRIDAVGISRTA